MPDSNWHSPPSCLPHRDTRQILTCGDDVLRNGEAPPPTSRCGSGKASVTESLSLPGQRQLLLPLLIPVEILYNFWRKSSYRVQDRDPESWKIVGFRIEGSSFFILKQVVIANSPFILMVCYPPVFFYMLRTIFLKPPLLVVPHPIHNQGSAYLRR